MHPLYPPGPATAVYDWDLGDGQCLHLEECGRPDGVPVVFLHGGPGAGCRPEHGRYFDPAYYRVLLLDQRGSGRSTPAGYTTHNDTRLLVADLEWVRGRLGIDRWLLFGGSWGATLALVYAETHPAAVLGLILRGTFLGRQRDLDWFFGPDGVARLLPDAWQAFRDLVPPAQRADLIAGYHALVHGADQPAAMDAARAWSRWGEQVMTWGGPPWPAPSAEPLAAEPVLAPILAKVRIETHYACARYFLEEDEILRRAKRLPRVPISIVHGRRDLVCPLDGAWVLHQAVPGARLVVVEAGHLISEPGMIEALVGETERLRADLGSLSLSDYDNDNDNGAPARRTTAAVSE